MPPFLRALLSGASLPAGAGAKEVGDEGMGPRGVQGGDRGRGRVL